MNTIVWLTQCLLATIFLLSGFLILFKPKEKLSQKMPFVNDFSPNMVRLVAYSHIAGALGLVLPLALNIYPVLTGTAAICLALVMLLAAWYNFGRNDKKGVAVDLILCTLFISIAAFRLSA